MTPEEFCQKCEYEGGLYDGFRYGLTEDHIDPSLDFAEFRELVRKARCYFLGFELARDMVADLAGDFDL